MMRHLFGWSMLEHESEPPRKKARKTTSSIQQLPISRSTPFKTELEMDNYSIQESSPQMCTPFRLQPLESAIDTFFSKHRNMTKMKTAMTRMDKDFEGEFPYWNQNVQQDRFGSTMDEGLLYRHDRFGSTMDEGLLYRHDQFGSTMDEGLLYRHDITNAIVDKINTAMEQGLGVMVQGPEGVGKSHSLVNVVQKLESSGDFLVTFIPDCQDWDDVMDLYHVICQSFGMSQSLEMMLDTLHLDIWGISSTQSQNFSCFIEAVDKILFKIGKKWVFVFDQVNALFDRFPDTLDVGALDFPFCCMTNLCQRGRITTVIGATVNNEFAFKNNGQWFQEYNHPLAMTGAEIRMLFPETGPKMKWKHVLKLTGGVPLQVQRCLDTNDDEEYRKEEIDRITMSLQDLRYDSKSATWKNIVKAAISCLTQVEVRALAYDRDNSVLESKTESGELYAPVNPLVLEAYQIFFCKEMKKNAKKRQIK